MIEVTNSKDDLLALRAHGMLTKEDYTCVLIPRLGAMISSKGKARCIFQFDKDFKGWEPAAFWADATFGLAHRNDFEKIAVVGGPKWVEWATNLSARIMSGEVHSFSADQVDEAWQWVQS